MDGNSIHLLEHVRTPAMVVTKGQVTFANAAAQALLGGHIVGQDVRIAIRNPAAIAVIMGEGGGTARVDGLSVGGSVWELDCHLMGGDERLVTLYDQSVHASTARAHADFVANASHELRTPLAAILGYVETLTNEKAGGDAPTRERFLGIIRHEAQRMHALVEDLMSLSRIEALKHEVPDRTIDMVRLARNIAGEFRERAQVVFESNCESAEVSGDEGQLAQALRNLVDNAVKYGRSDEPVVLALEATDTGWLSVAIRDRGEGIAPEHLPRLTERFYRADTSRSRAAGGTGLGLAIVKHIVERHRGRFDIASRQGAGPTASMMLPLRTG